MKAPLSRALSLSPPIQPAPPLVTSNGVAGATAPHVADGEMVVGREGRAGADLMPWIEQEREQPTIRGRKTGQTSENRRHRGGLVVAKRAHGYAGSTFKMADKYI